MIFLQVAKEKSEVDFNKLLHQLGSDIETMYAKHVEEKTALRYNWTDNNIYTDVTIFDF